jgi:sec-independent protein translocase protein TatC
VTYILQKIFGLRSKLAAKRDGNPLREMPFLDHLEELRQTLFRILVTLLITVVVSFGIRNWLFEVMRAPVEMAGLGIVEENHLPKGLTKARWKEADRIARAASRLPAGYHETYLLTACGEDKDLFQYVSAIGLFRAAVTLPNEQARSFLEQATQDNGELRKRAFAFYDAMPHVDAESRGNLILMSALGPTEGFMLSIKLSFFAGLVLAFPFLFYFGAQFVLPGLTVREKRIVIPYLGLGILLFALGVLFCYYVVTPRALKFFHYYNVNMGVESEWRIGYYISFVTKLTLGFGVSFQLPVVVMILVSLDLLSPEMMRRTRAYAVVIIVAIAAIITPTPDVVTLSFLAGPMLILYEISIWVAWFISRRRRIREAAEEAERALWLQKRREAAQTQAGTAAGQTETEQSEVFPLDENAHEPGACEPSRETGSPEPEDGGSPEPEDDPQASSSPSAVDEDPYEEGFGPPGPKPPSTPAVPYGESSLAGLESPDPDTRGQSLSDPATQEHCAAEKDSFDEAPQPEQNTKASQDPPPKSDHGEPT